MLARKSHVAAAHGARGLPWWGPRDGRHQRPHHGAVSGPGREVPATLRLWVAGPATPTWERGCLASTNGLALWNPLRAQAHGRSVSVIDSRHAASRGRPSPRHEQNVHHQEHSTYNTGYYLVVLGRWQGYKLYQPCNVQQKMGSSRQEQTPRMV